MKIGRLLAAGTSLMGLKDRVGRYRPVDPRAMPRFESPEGAGRAASAQAEPKAEEVARPVPVEPPMTAKAAEVPRSSGFPAPVCRADLPVRPKWWRRWLLFFIPVRAPKRVVAGPVSRRPVQAELRLEQVKVVRNDLSDTDLEVVTHRTCDQKKPEPERAEKTPAAPAKEARPGNLHVSRILS